MAKSNISLSDIILYEDDHYLVINKPAFLSTLEDRNDRLNALNIVRADFSEAQVCHRIDKETSGILLFAKHNEAYRHAASQFEQRQVYKEYHAIVDGKVNVQGKIVDLPLRLSGSGKGFVDLKYGKEAVTEFETLEVFTAHSLLCCKPITGRRHQIRIHVSHHNTPIVSDTLYGGKPFLLSSIKRNYHPKADQEELPLIRRFALHAHRIILPGLKGDKIDVKAEYPKDFMVVLKHLRRNNR